MQNELKGLRHKKKLLDSLEKKLENLEAGYVADVVRDYRNSPKGIPVVVRGFNSNKISELKRFYAEQVETLADEIKVAENLILSVENERDKLILQLRYIDGLKIWEIALEMGLAERTIHDILSRYK